MAIHLREPAADLAVRTLAARLGVSLTDAIRISAENELKRVGPRLFSAASGLRGFRSVSRLLAARGSRPTRHFLMRFPVICNGH